MIVDQFKETPDVLIIKYVATDPLWIDGTRLLINFPKHQVSSLSKVFSQARYL